MALDKADLELLAGFVRQEIGNVVSDIEAKVGVSPPPGVEQEPQSPEDAAAARAAVVGVPDVPPDAGPEFYIHLANGEVITSHDSASTHIADAEGKTQLVIGRYQVGG